MEKLFAKSKDKRHSEIISHLNTVIDLLKEIKKDSLIGEAVIATAKEYYTNDDMLSILRISKRTLARYRQQKLVNYYSIKGKVYYKVAEVQEFLKRKGKGVL
jgi:predicted Zn-ribbon and HTH transcriptional regulator